MLFALFLSGSFLFDGIYGLVGALFKGYALESASLLFWALLFTGGGGYVTFHFLRMFKRYFAETIEARENGILVLQGSSRRFIPWGEIESIKYWKYRLELHFSIATATGERIENVLEAQTYRTLRVE